MKLKLKAIQNRIKHYRIKTTKLGEKALADRAMHNNVFKSSHLFYYLGIGLVLLALVSLPIKVRVNVQSPEWPEYEDFNIGFFFAPFIGSYGLTSLALWIAEVSMSKKKSLLSFLPIFSLLYLWTLFLAWMAIRLGSIAPFWWFNLVINFVPTITVSVVGFANFVKKEYLVRVLKKQSIRIAAFSIMVTVPLLYVAVLWLLLVLV